MSEGGARGLQDDRSPFSVGLEVCMWSRDVAGHPPDGPRLRADAGTCSSPSPARKPLRGRDQVLLTRVCLDLPSPAAASTFQESLRTLRLTDQPTNRLTELPGAVSWTQAFLF